MAIINWNNGKPSFDYANNAALGVNLSRQVNAPLDVSSEFSSVKDMLYYVTEGRYPASGEGVSKKVKDMTKYPYLGQIIALVDTDAETVAVYYIKTAAYDAALTTDDDVFDHYFAEVGKATIGDNKSINLDVDTGVLSLNDYGVQYYEYDAKTSAYKSTPTPGWKSGLVPQVIADADSTKLAWFEPNPTTVEGLQTEITNLTNVVENNVAKLGEDNTFTATNTFSGNITTTGTNDFTASTTKVKDVTDASDDSEATNKKYVDEQISGLDTKIANLGSVFELKAVMTETEFNALGGDASAYEAGDVILVTITGVTGNTNKEYVVVEEGSTKRFELLGDPSGVTALEGRMTAAEGKITTLETTVGNSESGLVKDVNQLKTDLGSDDASGVRKRVKDLETTVGNASSGLVKAVADNTAAIASNDTDIASINDEIGSDDITTSIKGRIKRSETAIGTINVKLKEVEKGAQVNKLEAVALGTGVTGTVTPPTADNGKTATINITQVNSAASADTAKATTGTFTVFGKTFNGSADVTVTAADDIGIATAAKIGLVKSSSGTDKVSVADDGTMSVSKVSSAANADEAAKVAHDLKFGTKTYNGSSEETITLTDLGFDESKYATAAQGAKADTAVQTITIAGQAATGGTAAVVTADQLKTGLGLGTAAYKADTYFATATDFSALDSAAVKLTGDQTIDGNKTFNKAVSVATPTAEGHATTKKYVDEEIAKNMSAIDAMTFKGLLGEGEGNITTLPTTNVKNGDTYKVITAGTYADQAAKVGDMFIALVKNTSESETSLVWTLIPSGDENNGNVMAGGTLTPDQLVVGNGSQDVKTLPAGTNGQHLEMVAGKPTWADPNHTTITSEDESLSVTAGASSTYNVEVAKVNANLLFQTSSEYLILDGGSSTVNI